MLVTFPQRLRLVELVRSSGLPLWDPYLHGGQPFLANPTNLAWYPTALLYFVLPAVRAFNVEIVLHFLLCAFFTYWLARVLGLPPAAAFLAAAAAVFCGFTLSLGNLFNRLIALPNTIGCLLFWHLFLVERRTRWFVAAAVCGALAIVGGSTEFLLLLLVGALGWALAIARRPASADSGGIGVAWGALGLFAFGLAGAQILPAIEVVRRSIRGSGLDYLAVTTWSVHPLRLLESVIPGFFGPTDRLSEAAYWGARLEDSGYPLFLSLYFGIPVLALAAAEAFAGRDVVLPRRLRRFLFFLAAGCALAALGRHLWLTAALFRSARVMSLLRFPGKAYVGTVLPLAILAGAGAQRFARDGSGTLRRRLAWTMGALGAGLGVAALLFFDRAGAALGAAAALFGRPLAQDQAGLLAGRLLHASLASLGGALVLALRPPRGAGRTLGLAALVVLDLAVAGWPVNLYAPETILTREPSIATVARGALAGGRLFRDANSPEIRLPSDDIAAGYRWRRETLDAVLGNFDRIPIIFHLDYDSLARRRLVRLTSLVQKLPWPQRPALLSMGGVTLVLTAQPLGWPPFSPVAACPNSGNVPFVLYRNDAAAPPWGFVSTWARVGSEQDALRGVASRGFDPRRHVVVEGGTAPGRGGCGSRPVEQTVRTPTRWEGRVNAPCGGYVVFTEGDDPGWRVSVDGVERPILPANFAFSAVAVPPGAHTLIRTYRPALPAIGIAVSALAAILSLAAGSFCGRRLAKVELVSIPVPADQAKS